MPIRQIPMRSALRIAPRVATVWAAALAAVALAGCASVDSAFPTLRSFGVYKLDINQGNYLSQDMVDKLRVGQTKGQVRQLLGTALLVSPFRESRWDYVYRFTRQGRVLDDRKFTVYFVDEKLARWEGDEMPASVAELNREALSRTSAEEFWGQERSWWDSIVDVFGGR
jgi:outer membrane protein assembly factor BamE